jgi:hypothetical protein
VTGSVGRETAAAFTIRNLVLRLTSFREERRSSGSAAELARREAGCDDALAAIWFSATTENPLGRRRRVGRRGEESQGTAERQVTTDEHG